MDIVLFIIYIYENKMLNILIYYISSMLYYTTSILNSSFPLKERIAK